MKKIILSSIIFISLLSLSIVAHPGRTDSNGGHYNRSTGEYHYHNSGTTTLPTVSSIKPITKSSPEPEKDISPKPVSITENHWQVALNNNYFKGKMETILSTGRADIENDTQVVEVDKVSKYLEGIVQVLKYAEASGKQPVLALYIDGDKNGLELFEIAEKLCDRNNIKLILANCYVSTNDLINLINISQIERAKSQNIDETVSLPTINRFSDLLESLPKEQTEKKYWITTSSSVRHNSSCRYYMNSKGRMCTKNEGRACKICGG